MEKIQILLEVKGVRKTLDSDNQETSSNRHETGPEPWRIYFERKKECILGGGK